MCMHAEIKTDDGTVLPIMTFGPICICPDYQRPDTERLASFVVGRVGRAVSIEHGGRYQKAIMAITPTLVGGILIWLFCAHWDF